MEFGWISGPTVVLLIVLVNGFFVGSEMAMVASRRNRLEQLRLDGNANAAAALRIIGHLDRYIAACQFGITLASLSLGWVGEPAMAHLFEEAFAGNATLARFVPVHVVATIVTFSLITSMHIVLGELVPKSLSLQKAETIAMLSARPLTAFALVFRWPVAALTWIGNAVLRLGGLEPASGHEMVHTVAELRLLVTGSQKAGVVEESEARIVARAFTFADQTAGMVMTPRTAVESVPVDASREEVVSRLVASGRRRVVVHDGSLDRVLGVVHVRDILADVAAGPARPFDVRTFLRPVLAVPESKGIDEVLDELRGARDKLAVVVDEYGGTAGIVTLPDLVEPLVGRIRDGAAETPRGDGAGPMGASLGDPGGGPGSVEEGPGAPWTDGTRTFGGMTRLAEWEEVTGTALSDGDRTSADTLGGLVMARLGRMPEPGDVVDIGTHDIVVEALDGRRVDRVRARPRRTRPADGTRPGSPRPPGDREGSA